jgi:hypothetical protein
MNPRWLEDRILEILQEVKDLKAIMRTIDNTPHHKDCQCEKCRGK